MNEPIIQFPYAENRSFVKFKNRDSDLWSYKHLTAVTLKLFVHTPVCSLDSSPAFIALCGIFMRLTRRKCRRDSLKKVLSSPKLLEDFKTFLTDHHALETVEVHVKHLDYLRNDVLTVCFKFLKAVDKFQKTEANQRQKEADYIVKKFIRARAPFEVNIEFKLKEQIVQEVSESKISPSTFDSAYAQIFNLLLSDLFVRYCERKDS
jgi:hypothetical protein